MATQSVARSHNESAKPPSPADFDKFLPWACAQLQVPSVVVVSRVKQEEYVNMNSDRPKPKLKSKTRMSSQEDLSSNFDNAYGLTAHTMTHHDDVVSVETVYDSCNNLVQLKFEKNNYIPRLILQIIGLIIQYQIHLKSITIDRGIDQYILYEISKILPHSHLTDVCLDDTYIKNANYQVLLEKENFIQHLSLSRCSINDTVVQLIAATLIHPLPSSKTLSILNLSSNRISDEGAKFLSVALKSNRQLSYLSISDNMLTDVGARHLLDPLKEFPLCFTELLASRTRRITYLREKSELATRIARELRAGDLDKRSVKRKPIKTAPRKGKIEKDVSRTLYESKSSSNLEGFFEKASTLAENALGEFKDPFSKTNTYVKDAIVYCFGNNTLCYLNLAYNNLSYVTVRSLLDVLMYQKGLDRKPKGLISVSLEGNFIPSACDELFVLEQILNEGLSINQRKMSSSKKKNKVTQK